MCALSSADHRVALWPGTRCSGTCGERTKHNRAQRQAFGCLSNFSDKRHQQASPCEPGYLGCSRPLLRASSLLSKQKAANLSRPATRSDIYVCIHMRYRTSDIKLKGAWFPLFRPTAAAKVLSRRCVGPRFACCGQPPAAVRPCSLSVSDNLRL